MSIINAWCHAIDLTVHVCVHVENKVNLFSSTNLIFSVFFSEMALWYRFIGVGVPFWGNSMLRPSDTIGTLLCDCIWITCSANSNVIGDSMEATKDTRNTTTVTSTSTLSTVSVCLVFVCPVGQYVAINKWIWWQSSLDFPVHLCVICLEAE